MTENMRIYFTANNVGKPPSYGPLLIRTQKKLADCELYFDDGPLVGHKLQGFVIWEQVQATARYKVGDVRVSGPNFQYKVAGVSKVCGYLRPMEDDSYSYGVIRDPLRTTIIDAYKQWAKPKRSRARKLLSKVVGK